MSYVVARMQKRKASNLAGLQNHNDRKTENHSNKDIDKSKSKLNYDLVGHDKSVSYQKEIMDYINENKSSTRAVRKDAVVVSDWLITSDKNFFENKTPEETETFFKTAVNFFGERYGHENLKYATVHLDEKTPHMHLGIVPLRDGKLSAKTIFTRNELRDIQSELQKFFKENGFDLERGVEGSEAKHVHPEEHKKIENEMRMLVAESIVEFKQPREELTRDTPSEVLINREVNLQGHVFFMESENIAPLNYFSRELNRLASDQKKEIEEEKEKKLKDLAEFEIKAEEYKEKLVREQKNALRELERINTELEKAEDKNSLREQKRADFEDSVKKQFKMVDEISESLNKALKRDTELVKKLDPYRFMTSSQRANQQVDDVELTVRFVADFNALSTQEKIDTINILNNHKELLSDFTDQSNKYDDLLGAVKQINEKFSDKQKEHDELAEENDRLIASHSKLDEENKQLKVDNKDYKDFIKSDKKISERFKDFMQEKQQQIVQSYRRIRSR